MGYKLTQEFIAKTINEIEMEQNRVRKRRAFNSSQIRTGKLKGFVEKRIAQMYPKTHEMYTVTDYSILKKIVDKKAKAYKEKPIRKVQDSEAATLAYAEICKRYNLDTAMMYLDQSYNEHKYALMSVFMDREEESGKYYFNFYALEPYEYDVVKDEDGGLEVVILSYPTNSITSTDGDSYNALIAEQSKSDEFLKERFYSFWTETEYQMIKVSGDPSNDEVYIEFVPNPDNVNGVNPYGVLPFVYAPMDFDKNYPNPSPLPMQTVEFNALMSVYLTSANMQVGILKITRPEKQKINILSHSLYTAIEVPQSSRPEDPKADIDFISPTPNMSGHKEAIVTYLETILDEQGISSSQLVNPNQNFSSGFDRLLSQADVQSTIEENQEIYEKVEQEIYEIVATQLASVGQNILPLDALTITYKKPKIMVSDKDKLDNLKQMKDLGLWSDAELLQMFDPNLSLEDATLRLNQNREDKIAMLSTVTDPTKVFNGAQVTAIVDVSTKVGMGQLTYDAGVNILISSFGLSEDQARLMVPQEGTTQPVDAPMNGGFNANIP
jgi:hypothetical protein